MRNLSTFQRCAQRLKARCCPNHHAKNGYVLTDVMVALMVLGLLFSAIGGFVRISGLAISSAKEDMAYILQSRKIAGELRFLERAEPGAIIGANVLEYWIGEEHRGQQFQNAIGQFNQQGNLVYLKANGDILIIGQSRRRAPSTCRYDLIGRRCI